MAHAALQRRDEAVVRLDLQRADDAARHDEAEGVDRIGRVRAQDHVARRGDRLRHVGEAFLRAERRDDLRVGIELHAEAAGIIGGLGAAQARNAARRRIAVGARIAHDLAQLVDDRLRRRQVGIAHAEIDDVGAARAGAGLQPVDLLEDVRRQPADLVKFFHVSSRRCKVAGAIYALFGARYSPICRQGRGRDRIWPRSAFSVSSPCCLAERAQRRRARWPGRAAALARPAPAARPSAAASLALRLLGVSCCGRHLRRDVEIGIGAGVLRPVGAAGTASSTGRARAAGEPPTARPPSASTQPRPAKTACAESDLSYCFHRHIAWQPYSALDPSDVP